MPSKVLNKPKLICITGMDGVGKSTLADGLAACIASCRVSNIWDLLSSPIASLPFQNKRQIDHFLCALTPDSRLLFLAHALKYSIDMALKSQAEIILINSYYYKYFATELSLGADPVLVDHLAHSFPQPDLTIFLDLPVEAAAERKTVLSRYECGLVEKPSKAAFVDYQLQVQEKWKIFSRADWQHLDARETPASLLAKSQSLISKL